MDDPRLLNAALSASLAVKSALFAASTVKEAARPNVAAIAAEAATSQGARPVEAGAIGVELERLSRERAPDELPQDELVRAVAAAAAAAVANASGMMGETVQAMTSQAPAVDQVRLHRALSQVRQWFPLGELARNLGLTDLAQMSGLLAPLASEGYVKIENEHVWVTERGHRFLELTALT